jgi:hypothetical protein
MSTKGGNNGHRSKKNRYTGFDFIENNSLSIPISAPKPGPFRESNKVFIRESKKNCSSTGWNWMHHGVKKRENIKIKVRVMNTFRSSFTHRPQ